MSFQISIDKLSIAEIYEVAKNDTRITLGNDVREKVAKNRAFLEQKISETDARFYGINTGFGALCDVQIPADKIEQLQENLVMSHACGMG
ncbi:MAG TPA: aromatic amino acid lyase, partial [Chitinophagales bacterium]